MNLIIAIKLVYFVGPARFTCGSNFFFNFRHISKKESSRVKYLWHIVNLCLNLHFPNVSSKHLYTSITTLTTLSQYAVINFLKGVCFLILNWTIALSCPRTFRLMCSVSEPFTSYEENRLN